MKYEIKIFNKNERADLTNGQPTPARQGTWEASNVHTAVARALTGYPQTHRLHDVARTGGWWTILPKGGSITIEVRRV